LKGALYQLRGLFHGLVLVSDDRTTSISQFFFGLSSTTKVDNPEGVNTGHGVQMRIHDGRSLQNSLANSRKTLKIVDWQNNRRGIREAVVGGRSGLILLLLT